MNKRQLNRYFPIFVLPTFVAFCIGFIYPFLHGIYLSFCTFKTTSDAKFVGISNYIKAFADPGFLHAFWFTALFTVVSVIAINVLAFLVAYVLTSGIRGANAFRTVFFMPNLIGGVILGYIWQLIFNGILQNYGTNIKLNATFGFWGLIILLCWQQVGYMMIIYIAGLQNIPTELIEAAEIDGATHMQTLFKVKIPMVMPSITICIFLTLSNSFKLFDQNLSLTAGAPLHKTEMLALNIYQTFYGKVGQEGVGQAKAVLFFIIVTAISVIQLYATRKKEVEQ